MKEERKKKKVVYIVIWIAIAWIVLFGIAKIFDRNDLENSASDKIAMIPVIGEITSSGSSSGFILPGSGASSSVIVSNLEKAEKDKSVKAIILEINSPGGTVVASEEIANKVKSIEKPVVAWIREIGTSGAYWVASASDTIVADPLSITGSIGVIGSYLDYSKLFDKYGITYDGLTTGKYKDIGSPYKELTQEEKSLLLTKMNIIHDAFVEEVAENRGMDKNQVREIASGIFYIGKEAKELGLVDKLGGKSLAIDTAKNLAGLEKAEIIKYEEKRSLIDYLGQIMSYPAYYVGRGLGFEISQRFDPSKISIEAI